MKYLNKVWFPESYLVIEENSLAIDRIISDSIEEFLKKLEIKYRSCLGNRSYFKISIYNFNADRKVIPFNGTIRDLKDELCKHAYQRTIYISNTLDEVYSEVFELYNDYVNDGESYYGYHYTFDYGILYSDISKNLPEIKTSTKYLEFEELDSHCPLRKRKRNPKYYYGITNIEAYAPEGMDGFCNGDYEAEYTIGDIYMAYTSYITEKNKTKGTGFDDYPYDPENSCIPFSTFIL